MGIDSAADVEAIYQIATANRLLAADMFADLTPEQWRTPSLCAGWTVREVAAHLLEPLETKVDVLKLLAYLVRYRGSLDRMVDETTRKVAARPTDELVTGLRERASTRLRPPVIGPLGPMTDTGIHLRDAARPLGLDVCPPPASWRPALDFLVSKPASRGFIPATDSSACASSPPTRTGSTERGPRSTAAARPSPWRSPVAQLPSMTSPAPAPTSSGPGSCRSHPPSRRPDRRRLGVLPAEPPTACRKSAVACWHVAVQATPVVPSVSSRRMSAWPACRAVSSIMCT